MKFNYSDSDGILNPDEKITLILYDNVTIGPLRVTGECDVGDEIDIRYT
jgi:hypothetical protein